MHKQIAEKLRMLPEPVLIVSHPRPDGDAVGSVVAMRSLLRAVGKNTVVFMPDVPEYLTWATDGVVVDEAPDNCASVVLLDTTGLDRTLLDPEYCTDKPTVSIDHHEHTKPGKSAWVDPQASSACEMIWELIERCLFDPSPEAATACYLGIRTDTGNFSYGTSPRTLQVASSCLVNGADSELVCKQLAKRTPAEVSLLGLALHRATAILDNQVMSVILTKEDLADIVRPDMQQSLTILRSITNIKFSLSLTQNKDGSWKGSLRASKPIVVNQVAAEYNGGGHPQAAGFKLPAGADPEATVLEIAEKILAAQ